VHRIRTECHAADEELHSQPSHHDHQSSNSVLKQTLPASSRRLYLTRRRRHRRILSSVIVVCPLLSHTVIEIGKGKGRYSSS